MIDNSQRDALVQSLRQSGIRDERVLAAINNTPREEFLPEELQSRAYEDNALPIGEGQTISQPYIVALMSSALNLTGREIVLEIGTGSGYQAAVLAQLCRKVITIERLADLSHRAQRVLARLNLDNIEFQIGDGTLGYPSAAPYDGIIVTAAAPEIPQALCEQLAVGGRMAIPIGNEEAQELRRIVRLDDGFSTEKLCDVRFVPLIGKQGWQFK